MDREHQGNMTSTIDGSDLSDGFDPRVLIEMAKKVAPELPWLPEALNNCGSGTWKSRAYVHYVSSENANKPGAAWQYETTVGFSHPSLGLVHIDILKGQRIGGIEFVDKIE